MFEQQRRFRGQVKALRQEGATFASASESESKGGNVLANLWVKVLMQVGLSLIITCVCLYALFFGEVDETVGKFAAGWIGVILGFWLR